MIVLKSSDGEIFEVEEAVALQSQILKHVIEDVGANAIIPLPNVSSKVLEKVIFYCQRYIAYSQDDRMLKSFNYCFVNFDEDLKQSMLFVFDLALAANYLNIKSLLDLTCQAIGEKIKGKTPEEIRKTFNIKNDFTPEEEEEIRRENAWAFE